MVAIFCGTACMFPAVSTQTSKAVDMDRDCIVVQWPWSSGLAGWSIQWQCCGGDTGVEPALSGERDQGTLEQEHSTLFLS